MTRAVQQKRQQKQSYFPIVRINTGDPPNETHVHCEPYGLNFLWMCMSTPKIKPIKMDEFTSTQSKYDHCAQLPTRSLILAPSGGGKTVLLQNMILDIYKDCFSRIYIFSPSIDVDMTWEPVEKVLS